MLIVTILSAIEPIFDSQMHCKKNILINNLQAWARLTFWPILIPFFSMGQDLKNSHYQWISSSPVKNPGSVKNGWYQNRAWVIGNNWYISFSLVNLGFHSILSHSISVISSRMTISLMLDPLIVVLVLIIQCSNDLATGAVQNVFLTRPKLISNLGVLFLVLWHFVNSTFQRMPKRQLIFMTFFKVHL